MTEGIEKKLQRNVPLAPLTTMRVGGASRFFLSVKSEEELSEAVKFAENEELEIFILGGGSNVLISDEGFDGLTISLEFDAIKKLHMQKNQALVYASAGRCWDEFVKFCVEQNLAGVECLSGIPGKVGAVPIQNVGAYGQEVSETIRGVRVFDLETKQIYELTKEECRFDYRSSIFNTIYKDRFIVLGVSFCLKEGGSPKIVYKDLIDIFGDKSAVSLKEVREAVIRIRRQKAMVIDESEPNSRSCGSFFKNPILTKKEFCEVIERTQALGVKSVPSFIVGHDAVKIPAAWLIERAGFYKGYRFKGAGISEKHALALVNFSNATALDILNLAELIRDRVREKFGVELVPEPVFVGFKKVVSMKI
ncbi:MAG: UDP-N-acetylmuramate dehydrogenase [Pyrinomonadaceae bacterium]|nr:UDP-N-acetylmuramate dehydrogenase [Pyrinomonadaceae bacterium]MCX7640039.1 UDP-N-acetylmuramate dehydrogenase [Pyrinomonadaceae bacterium]MDW8304211.1 UDP-N-acetylmuramate dehydrogenase [Acidobacteriota bacterium]